MVVAQGTRRATLLAVFSISILIGVLHAFAPQRPRQSTATQFPNAPIIIAVPRQLFSSSNEEEDDEETTTPRQRLQKRVSMLAKRMATSSIARPKAIASVLADATLGAVDMAVEEVLARRENNGHANPTATATDTQQYADNLMNASTKTPILSAITMDLVRDVFQPMERSLEEMEASLGNAKRALATAKSQASQAMEAIQAAAIAEAMGAASVVEAAQEEAERQVLETIYESAGDDRLTIDWNASEMAPPFLDEASCLVPGEPVVRVERAPENSRRIFAGIDIMASVDDVWEVLTEYHNLQNVVPNLVVNEVLETYDGVTDYSLVKIDGGKSDREQCQEMAQQMRGSLLKQVGGAKVAGINFSARTTLEVREWPRGLPDFAHYQDEVWDGKSRTDRAREYVKTKLARYKFPRPFAISSLPTKDISMQSVPNDDGEFRLYQGVWRMQPLPGCAAPGKSAMRLTYAVEISPRAYLPVQLVEGRIVKDLCNNLLAIRDCVAGKVAANPASR